METVVQYLLIDKQVSGDQNHNTIKLKYMIRNKKNEVHLTAPWENKHRKQQIRGNSMEADGND